MCNLVDSTRTELPLSLHAERLDVPRLPLDKLWGRVRSAVEAGTGGSLPPGAGFSVPRPLRVRANVQILGNDRRSHVLSKAFGVRIGLLLRRQRRLRALAPGARRSQPCPRGFVQVYTREALRPRTQVDRSTIN